MRLFTYLAIALGTSFVGATSEPLVAVEPEPEPDPEPQPCTDDVYRCPDGTYVSRDENCNFTKCPPVVCENIKAKFLCRRAAKEHGCQYLNKKEGCVHKDDIKCPSYSKKYACKKSGKCIWKGGCKPMCPEPDPTKPCTKEFKPVKCGNCEYANSCLARNAGHKLKLCSRVCKSKKECWKQQICYSEKDEEGVCIKPTGHKCMGFAGFSCPIGEKCVKDLSDSCAQGNGSDCMGVCINYGCKKPRPNRCKDDEFNPVMCGDCSYGSPCLAKSAGVDTKTCRPFCPRPMNSDTEELQRMPPERLSPVVCGKGKCNYQSKSMAMSAGFHTDQCTENCASTVCLACPKDTKSVDIPGECCPKCEPQDKCANKVCEAIKECPNGEELVMDDSGCCKICPKPVCEKECKCARGYKPKYDDEGCCIGCKADNPCTGIVCEPCPLGSKHIEKPGECCPTCGPIDKCALVLCLPPEDCPDGEIVKDASGCCDVCKKPTCEKECKCEEGSKPMYDKEGCCIGCDKPMCAKECKCENGSKPTYGKDGCCIGCEKPTCEKECKCEKGSEPMYDKEGCCIGCEKSTCDKECMCEKGSEPIYDDDGCCVGCEKDPCFKVNCNKCPPETMPVSKPGQCCPSCEPIDKCANIKCEEIKECPDGEIVKDSNGCCDVCKKPTCEKECMCEKGSEPMYDKEGCCIGCEKPTCDKECMCGKGSKPIYGKDGCCIGCEKPACEKECQCEKGSEPMYDKEGCCIGCEKPTCDKECMCGKGSKPIYGKDGCCIGCEKPACETKCKCEKGSEPLYGDDGCCIGCEKDPCFMVNCNKCPPDTMPVSKAGQCCPSCEPIDKCANKKCEEIKECPRGEKVVKNGDGCCDICKPSTCDTDMRECKLCEVMGQQPKYDDEGCCIGCERENPCEGIKCPRCEYGAFPLVRPDQCCPTCRPPYDECDQVFCPAIRECPNGEDPVKDASGCCDVCPEPKCEKECKCQAGSVPIYDDLGCCSGCKPDKDHCNGVRCMRCPLGTKSTYVAGECCPICEADCSMVACRQCPADFKPVEVPGECCPRCIPPNYDECSLVDCKKIDRCPPGEKLVKDSSGCCNECKPEINPCAHVRCAYIELCPNGQPPVKNERGCCPYCPDEVKKLESVP